MSVIYSNLQVQGQAVRIEAALSVISQAQPEPKRPAAAALNFSLNASKDPNEESIAPLSSLLGPLLSLGFVITCAAFE